MIFSTFWYLSQKPLEVPTFWYLGFKLDAIAVILTYCNLWHLQRFARNLHFCKIKIQRKKDSYNKKLKRRELHFCLFLKLQAQNFANTPYLWWRNRFSNSGGVAPWQRPQRGALPTIGGGGPKNYACGISNETSFQKDYNNLILGGVAPK